MQQFIAEESFWDLFPDAAVGIVVARGMKSAADVSPEKATMLSQLLVAANGMAEMHLTSDTISENDVVKVWRDAYRSFKTKKGARCSIENLLKRVLKGNPVRSINPSVDIYNAISLKYALPVGGEDIDAFVGDVRLGLTEGGDSFLPLGENDEDPTLPGELCIVMTPARSAAAGIGAMGNAAPFPTIRKMPSSSSNASTPHVSTT